MPQYQEHLGIAAIDDISALLSDIRESVYILARRYRVEFTPADVDELRRILEAADKVHERHLDVRREMSAAYRKR